jgi:hypothetical protein
MQPAGGNGVDALEDIRARRVDRHHDFRHGCRSSNESLSRIELDRALVGRDRLLGASKALE